MTRQYTDSEVARVCHEANRALQYILGDPVPSPPWDAEDTEIRESAIEGVRNARAGVTPRENHESWVRYRAARGWTYGPDKDIVKKTHPCMVDYGELPGEQQLKDRLFTMIVTAMTIQ